MPASDPRQAAATPRWRVRGRTIDLDRPVVLGIVNVTPDSFSDGGNFFSREAAEAHAGQLLQEGADVLDVGGESTRPQGATAVDAEEEMRRILPVVAAIRKRFPEAIISVDTVKSVVAAEALAEGAQIINDVSGLRLDGKMGPVCAAAGAGVILMHSRGGVSTMGTYLHATYGADVTGEVAGELADRAREAVIAGVARESIVVDPGIGFSKRSEHSLTLLAELPRIAALGYPVLVGVSRKRFIGEITGETEAAKRVFGTVGANVMAMARGARLFRVHDVRASRQALDAAWAIMRQGMAGPPA